MTRRLSVHVHSNNIYWGHLCTIKSLSLQSVDNVNIPGGYFFFSSL